MTFVKFFIILYFLNLFLNVLPHKIRKKDKPENVDVFQIEKYLVSIFEGSVDPQPICTGTVLTERWVLTASKCIEDYSFQAETRAVLNYFVLYPKNENSSLVPVEEINIHVEILDNDKTISDIALLKTLYSIYSNFFDDFYEEMNAEIQEDTVKLSAVNIFRYEHPHFINSTCFGNAWVDHGENSNSSKRMLELKIWPVYLVASASCKNDSHQCDPLTVESDIEFIDRIDNKGSKSLVGAALICDEVQLAVLSKENSIFDQQYKWIRIDTLYNWIINTLDNESKSKITNYHFDKDMDGTCPHSRSSETKQPDSFGIIFAVIIAIVLVFIIGFMIYVFVRSIKMQKRELAIASLENSDYHKNKWIRIDTLFNWIRQSLDEESSSKILTYRSDQDLDGLCRDFKKSKKIDTPGIIAIVFASIIAVGFLAALAFLIFIFIRSYKEKRRKERERKARMSSRFSHFSMASTASGASTAAMTPKEKAASIFKKRNK